MRARYEVAVEHYNKVINIEGQTMTAAIANRYILPAAPRVPEACRGVGQRHAAAAGVECTEGKKLPRRGLRAHV